MVRYFTGSRSGLPNVSQIKLIMHWFGVSRANIIGCQHLLGVLIMKSTSFVHHIRATKSYLQWVTWDWNQHKDLISNLKHSFLCSSIIPHLCLALGFSKFFFASSHAAVSLCRRLLFESTSIPSSATMTRRLLCHRVV